MCIKVIYVGLTWSHLDKIEEQQNIDKRQHNIQHVTDNKTRLTLVYNIYRYKIDVDDC